MGKALEIIKLAVGFLVVVTLALAAGHYLLLIAQSHSPPGQLSFKDCMDVAQVAITALGLGSIALLWKQLRDASRWSKLLSYHQFFASFPSEDIVKNLTVTLKEHKQDHILRDRTASLPADVAKKLYELNEPDGSKASIDNYLNDFESFCAAIHCGLISENYAYNLEGGRVIRSFHRFGSYIQAAQDANKRAFQHFKRCAIRWKARRDKEDDSAASRETDVPRAP